MPKSKFFYITEEDLNKINLLFKYKDPSSEVVLQQNERFADVVKYNDKYDTLVFLTIPRE